jgi:hypothetical protein
MLDSIVSKLFPKLVHFCDLRNAVEPKQGLYIESRGPSGARACHLILAHTTKKKTLQFLDYEIGVALLPTRSWIRVEFIWYYFPRHFLFFSGHSPVYEHTNLVVQKQITLYKRSDDGGS